MKPFRNKAVNDTDCDNLFSFIVHTLRLSMHVTFCLTIHMLLFHNAHIVHSEGIDIALSSCVTGYFMCVCAHVCLLCTRDKGQLAFRRIKDCQRLSDGVGKSLNLCAGAIRLCPAVEREKDRCIQ